MRFREIRNLLNQRISPEYDQYSRGMDEFTEMHHQPSDHVLLQKVSTYCRIYYMITIVIYCTGYKTYWKGTFPYCKYIGKFHTVYFQYQVLTCIKPVTNKPNSRRNHTGFLIL